MNLITIIVIAVALAMDAFAVSIVTGSTCRKLHVKHALRMAAFFGGFQAIMPLIGYQAGLSVKEYIENYDHWIAFVLLSAVGIKMIYESFRIKPTNENLEPSGIIALLVLSVATSIDALAVGITLSIITNAVIVAVIIIGLITFLLSYVGVAVGKKYRHFFENRIEALSGFILCALALKILISHTIC